MVSTERIQERQAPARDRGFCAGVVRLRPSGRTIAGLLGDDRRSGYGDETMTGVVRDTTFYHGALRVVVKFPDNWTVDKSKTEVRATAPGGNKEAIITWAGTIPTAGSRRSSSSPKRWSEMTSRAANPLRSTARKPTSAKSRRRDRRQTEADRAAVPQ